MKHTYRIRQHTPMLQFQAEQENAFLRASDLKARIDKVLENTVTNNVKKIKYRLLVLPNELIIDEYYQKLRNNSLYYAHMRNANFPTKLVMAKERTFEIQVHTFDPDFNEETFEKALRTCLLMNNFGTRASKGFGSFSLEGDSQQIVEQVLREQLPTQISLFRIDLEATDWIGVFSEINSFYKSIKSRTNGKYYRRENRRNNEPYLKEWLASKQILFDKVEIKERLFNKVQDVSARYPQSKTGFYSRGMLGYSTIDNYLNQNCTVEYSIDKVQRIPSPILFKPMKFGQNNQCKSYTLYFFLNPAVVTGNYTNISGEKVSIKRTTCGEKDSSTKEKDTEREIIGTMDLNLIDYSVLDLDGLLHDVKSKSECNIKVISGAKP